MIQKKQTKVSSGAVAVEFKLPIMGILTQVFIKIGGVTNSGSKPNNGDIYIEFKDGKDEDYDVVFADINPTNNGAYTDLTSGAIVWLPSVPISLAPGDSVRVRYSNPSDRAVYVTMLGSDDPDL